MRRQTAVLVLLLAATTGGAGMPVVHAGRALAAGCSAGPANAPTTASTNLDRVAGDWGVFCDGPEPTWLLRNVPTPATDQESLECGITGGQPYAGLHCYRNFRSEPTANWFRLKTLFRFTPATTCNNASSPSVVQGLEFSISKWLDGQRWEFAVQLENVASSAGSAAPQWRWWNGADWIAFTPTLSDCLAADTWHSMELTGSIVNGMVRYDDFTVDSQTRALGMTAAPVVSSQPDKLAVGVQLDANSAATPYSVYLDKVSFLRHYAPVTPARVLDTRTGIGGHPGKLGPGETAAIPVTGVGGVPRTGAGTVVMNVTATEATAPTYVTVFPSGRPRPIASNLNIVPGRDVPNLVVAKVGGDGMVSLYNNAGAVHLIFDVVGWFPAGDTSFTSLTPARILDTRAGPPGRVGAGQTIQARVTGAGGVPATGVEAVVLNVTVTEPTAASHLTVYPCGEARPLASSLNFVAGQDLPNLVIVKVGTAGMVCLYNNAGAVHLILDVTGWFVAGSVPFASLPPARILDTRDGTGGHVGPVGSAEAIDVAVTGVGGVPVSGVGAVVLNVTVTGGTTSSYLTVYPSGEARPNASNLNFGAGQDVANAVVAKVGAGGKVSVYNNAGAVHAIFDVAGWFAD
jgi:hypothetical protein